MGAKTFVILLILCSLSAIANAQTDTSFWFAAPAIVYNPAFLLHSDRPISLHFTSLNKAANITISQPANSSFTPIQFSLPANSSRLVDLTPFIDSLETKPADKALNYGLLIRSSSFISAYYEESSPYNPEIFVLKGRNALGKNFFIPAQDTMSNELYTSLSPGLPVATSSFDIVATEDNTVVTITPANDIIGHTATSGSFSITLQKGQTYSATATGALGSQHLMGSTVTSNKPVAITIKDDSIGAGYASCEDLVGDQIVPLEIVGTKYISLPGRLNISTFLLEPTDHLFILATQDNTIVKINGIQDTILNTGQTYWKQSFNQVFYIETSFPVYILQITGFGCEMAHALLPQLECTGSKTVGFMRSNKDSIIMNLLVPAGGETKFSFNGDATVIPIDSFHDVLNIPPTAIQWKYAQIPLSTSQLPFNFPAIVTNPIDFHLAILDGDSYGARYGFFSSFNSFTAVPKSIPGTDKPFCEGDSIQLFCDVGSSEGISYSWTGPNGFASAEQNPVLRNLKFADSGSYACIAVKPNCSSKTISLSINVMPPIQRLLSVNNNLCANDTLILSVSSTMPGASFLWEGPNNYNSNMGKNSLPGISSGKAGNYILITTDTVGCITKDTVVVVVNPLPSAMVSGNNIICENDSLSLNGTSSAPGVTFLWKGPSGYTNNTSNAYINKVSPDSGGFYYLTTTSTTGCAKKDTVLVTIKPLPSATIISNAPLCRLQDLLLKNNNVLTASSYSWSHNDRLISNQQNINIGNFSYVDSGKYYLMVSSNGCIANDSINVALKEIPVIKFDSIKSVCINQPPFQILAFDTTGLPGSGIFTGNGISAAGIFDPSIGGAGSSLIRYTYTANNGCSEFKEQSVSKYESPVVTTISPVTIFSGGSVLLNTTIKGDFKFFNWTPITGLNNPSLVSPVSNPLSDMDYTITVSDDKGCVASATAVIKVLAGIKIPNAFSPNGDGINDKWIIDNLAEFAESTVNIFDRYGKRVFSSKGYNTPWDGNFNGKPLQVATYYYVITIGDGHISQTYSGWVVLLR